MDIVGRAFAIGEPIGDAFDQHFLKMVAEGIRRQQIGDRTREHDDVAGSPRSKR
jgi:hypothetical protein